MTRQAMFYEKAVPVDRTRHAGWSVARVEAGFGFAAKSVAVPLMAAEFLSAATCYPIVFTRAGDDYTPVVMLGVQTGRSLYVDKDGVWTGEYLPAFLRRYPFAFSTSEDGETHTLCIDEAHAGCDPTGQRGERLFDEKGEPAPCLQQALDFAWNFETEHGRTREFCGLLVERGLLEAMDAELAMADGTKQRMTGFHIVSRKRLKALEGEMLADLFRRDALELIYYHLASLKNLERLRRRGEK